MRIVDTKGQLCPAPLIAAKKALKETPSGESFIVLTDNQTSFDNLSRFLKDNKADFQVSESGGVWTLTTTKTTSDVVQTKAEEYCPSSISPPRSDRADARSYPVRARNWTASWPLPWPSSKKAAEK